MRHRPGYHTGVVAALVAASAPGMVAAKVPTDHVRIVVPEQPLDSALVEFAIQANVTISTPRGGFGDVRARELHGSLTADEGLRRLLAHTPFSVERLDRVTFRIVPVARARKLHPPAPKSGASDEVVILAARQPRVLDRFAASASVTDGETLSRLNARSAMDLTETVAGLGFTNLGPGRNKIMVRGLSDGAFSGRTESTIGVYFGDSRITYAAPDPDLLLVDIDRVEILRGPQGTLYGGGAIGGIYRITPALPDLASVSGFLSGDDEATRGGNGGAGISGMINLPIIGDRVGARLVGYREKAGGWLDNPSRSLENTNATTREGFRATVLAQVSSSWTVTARAQVQGIDSADSQYTSAVADGHERTNRLQEPHDNDFVLYSLSARGNTPLGALETTTSVLHHVYDSRFDATGAFASLGDVSAPRSYDEDNDLEFTVEEARLTGVASPFPWTIGAFASVGRLGTATQVAVNPESANAANLYANHRYDRIREYALYGEATWPLTRKIGASIGLRAFRTVLDSHAIASSAVPDLTDTFAGKLSYGGVSPQFRLSYEPSPGAFYYLQASNGYRSGGFNAGAISAINASPSLVQPFRSYGPDDLWSYEAGAKHSFLSQRLLVRGAVFWQMWEDVQTDQLILSDLSFTGNAGNGEIRGGEVEAHMEVKHGFALAANATYVDAEIVHADPTFPAGRDAGLPGAPKITAGATLTYQAPLFGTATLHGHLGASYIGSSNVTFAHQANVEIGDYTTLNGAVGIETSRWQASVYAENIADSDGGTFSYGNPFQLGAANLVTPLRPRTIGVEISRRF